MWAYCFLVYDCTLWLLGLYFVYYLLFEPVAVDLIFLLCGCNSVVIWLPVCGVVYWLLLVLIALTFLILIVDFCLFCFSWFGCLCLLMCWVGLVWCLLRLLFDCVGVYCLCDLWLVCVCGFVCFWWFILFWWFWLFVLGWGCCLSLVCYAVGSCLIYDFVVCCLFGIVFWDGSLGIYVICLRLFGFIVMLYYL